MNLQSMRRIAVPLHAEVAEVLRCQIMSGTLATGTRLPALRELTQQLGVARMTVVQAMNTLEEEGLIEKYPGRGTFVKRVRIPARHTLHMNADISQIHRMVDQLEVSVHQKDALIEKGEDGRYYRSMSRIHTRAGKPFCQVDIKLDDRLFERAPERFSQEIVVSVLRDLGITIHRARQKITISYADFIMARALAIKVNSAIFRVFRQFLDDGGQLIYCATLHYPADLLELEMEFTTNQA